MRELRNYCCKYARRFIWKIIFVRFNSVDEYYVVISGSYRVSSGLLTTKVNQSMLYFPKVPYLRAILGSRIRLINFYTPNSHHIAFKCISGFSRILAVGWFFPNWLARSIIWRRHRNVPLLWFTLMIKWFTPALQSAPGVDTVQIAFRPLSTYFYIKLFLSSTATGIRRIRAVRAEHLGHHSNCRCCCCCGCCRCFSNFMEVSTHTLRYATQLRSYEMMVTFTVYCSFFILQNITFFDYR